MVGKPFANPQGTKPVLEHLFALYGVDRNDVITTNVVLCQSDDPPKEAIAACKPRLEHEISQCELVIAAGTEAVNALTKYRAVFTARPFVHNRTSVSGVKQRVIATNNPALVIRDSDTYPDLVDDFRRAFDPPPPFNPPVVEIINEPDRAVRIIEGWINTEFKTPIASDLEWRSTTGEYVCAGFSARREKAIVFGYGSVGDRAVQRALKQFYERRDVQFTWHNGKADTKVLRTAGIDARVDQDTFLQSYCHVPGTKILKTNLTWVNIEDLVVGDELVGYEDQKPFELTPSKVTRTQTLKADCYKITTNKKEIIVSEDHLWLVRRAGARGRKWISTKELARRFKGLGGLPPKFLLTYFCDPWVVDESKDAGYLQGIFDGEGCLGRQGGTANEHKNWYKLSFTQKSGEVLNKTLAILDEMGIEYKLSERGSSGIINCNISKFQGMLKILGSIRPARFEEHTKQTWVGIRKLEPVQIENIEYVGEQEVIAVGTTTKTFIADGFLSHNCLDERPGYHSLEYLLSTRFGYPDYEPSSVKSFKKTGEFFGKTPQERAKSEYELYKYNGWDTAGTFQLFGLLDPKLDTDRGGEVRTLYKRLLYASERFTTVELNGFNYDVEEAANINDRAAIPLTIKHREELRKISGHSLLNPNSPKQLQVVYYEQFGLKHNLRDTGKKKLARSTGKEVREEILDGRVQYKIGTGDKLREFAEFHRAYAKIVKLRGNYLEGLILRTQRDGKLYCRFNPCGTVSGRSSSNDPNLQNIAREGYSEIPGIRTLFTPSDNCVILSADYSQAELRTCAKLSGDSSLLDIYRDGTRSLHKERAAAFYGENYTYEEYVKSKNINFGVTYGQGADAFAQMYHMPKSEAQAYIDGWWEEFNELGEWVAETQKRALRDGYVQSPFGHKRRFSLVTNDNIGDVKREAVSSLPQNIAAWLTIHALCDLVDNGVRVVATVHDSIVADVPIDEVSQTASLMRDLMREQPIKQLGWSRDDIPFEADISVGPSWGQLDEYEIRELVAA
jgi:uracil-DNA glycosylase family 4